MLEPKKQVQVRPHARLVDGKLAIVSPHSRTVSAPVPLDTPSAEEPTSIRKTDDILLWEKWSTEGKQKKDLIPILQAYKPLINSRVSVYANKVSIPTEAIELEAKAIVVKALHSYDPSKGPLSAYLGTYLHKLKRFIGENQNIGRIPENRLFKIGEFNRVKNNLESEFDRPVTNKELATALGWPLAEVDRMSSELVKTVTTELFEDDPFVVENTYEQELLRDFQYELPEREREVFRYLTGIGRPLTPSTKDIGKELNLPEYTVSRIKASIIKKLQPHLKKKRSASGRSKSKAKNR